MIKTLSISNFAIIDYLEINFDKGMTTITGETGTGKSIILGALSMVLGKRADLTVLKNPSKKCIIEAYFDVSKYNLKTIFHEENIDYENETTLRRELIPSGKSRAFVNDGLVNLETLTKISSNLIDIHNQNEMHTFFNSSFQFKFIDSLSDSYDDSNKFKIKFLELKADEKSLRDLIKINDEGIKEYDYQRFLYEELESLNLKKDSLKNLEDEVSELSNIYEVKSKLSFCVDSINSDENGILTRLSAIMSNLTSLKITTNKVSNYYSRINSLNIELKDIFNEMERYSESLDYNPELLDIKNSRLDKIYSIFKKHKVSSIDELIQIRNKLSKAFFDKNSFTKKLDESKKIFTKKNEYLLKLSKKIHDKRIKAIPKIEQKLNSIVNNLGMKNAKFKFNLIPLDEFNKYGKEKLVLLFSPNLGTEFKPIKKIISGGELSRVMLSVKYMISKRYNLPTIIFDEIDSGVSGKVANQIGIMMHSMSDSNQILAITHIPQVASRGDKHIKVFKEVVKSVTHTNLKELTNEEREIEIASMLSGKKMTSSAIKHARELLE